MQDLQALGAAIITPPDKRLAMTAAALAMPVPLGFIAAAVARNSEQDTPTTPIPPPTPKPGAIVPSILEEKKDDAVRILDDVGLKPAWGSGAYSSDAQKDTVVFQNPEEGKKVPAGSTVKAELGLGPDPKVPKKPTQEEALTEALANLNATLNRIDGKLDAVLAATGAGASGSSGSSTQQSRRQSSSQSSSE